MDVFENGIDFESIDEGKGVGRRTFLMGALATGAALSGPFNYAAAARKRAIPMANDGAFRSSVASGFPRPQGISLWTRLAGLKQDAKLDLVIAKDRHFSKVVEERQVVALKKQDFTARTFVNGLDPDEQYFYRFLTNESKSQVGRFKTAPPLNSRKPIRIAFYSCQAYEAGFYNAQRAIANEPDLDLVLCLGDYIYEYSDNKGVRLDRTGRNNDGDVQFVDEYWDKYKLYKSDQDLKAMHEAHPFICVWDDHEVEDNRADGRPSSAHSDPNTTQLKNYPRRVSFAQRTANGNRAFFTYHPRMRFKGDRNRIYEDYRLGKNLDLLLTDERQYRDPQPCNDEQVDPAGCPSANDPRTMLGAKQLDWFLRSLKGSKATWKVWGTQLMVMATRLAPTVPAQVDAWDGYAYERRKILDYILDNNIQNVAAITGDIHTFFAGTAWTGGDENLNGSRAAIPEFVGSAATSNGLSESTGIPESQLQILALSNPHIDFYNFSKKGYGVLTVSKNETICELKAVDHRTKGAGTPTTLAKFRVPLGARTAQQI